MNFYGCMGLRYFAGRGDQNSVLMVRHLMGEQSSRPAPYPLRSSYHVRIMSII